MQALEVGQKKLSHLPIKELSLPLETQRLRCLL